MVPQQQHRRVGVLGYSGVVQVLYGGEQGLHQGEPGQGWSAVEEAPVHEDRRAAARGCLPIMGLRNKVATCI